ncbi:hypothetical protein GJAV_G00116820 [Gymnothorax javanicus]|nr:hypothetical protein GJAV_G00116820 [Gymnothorax javanicus]
MVNVLKGVLVECDPAMKQFLLHLDETSALGKKFIIQDLDDTHVFILAEVVQILQERFASYCQDCAIIEVKYLGHVILADGVATDPDKIKVVAEWKTPTNTTELRSFLGFASYYCRFVEGFAKYAAPLHNLVGELQGCCKNLGPNINAKLNKRWDDECEQAFTTLKNKLISASVLGYADFTQPFILGMDASHQGLGAVLSQEHEGKPRPVAFASRAENYAQQKGTCPTTVP